MTDLTPINPTTTIVALALTNVLTDIWHEQNKHKDIGDHPEEFRKFCESVLTLHFPRITPMESDIVERLRYKLPLYATYSGMTVDLKQAIEEIERLQKECFHLAANQCHSGYAGEYGHHRCSEIDRLTKERDEARWEVCGFHHLTGFLAGDYAISRGWNYFNDERKWAKFPPSVTDFKEFLKAHSDENLKTIERLREENRQLRENRND